MSGLDFVTNGEIFRKNQTAIIATNRHQAAIIGARVVYDASGFKAGTVMARNSVSGFYAAYNDAASSGLDTAVGVLFHDIDVEDFASTGATTAANVIVKGNVFQSKIIGLDANAIVDLKARSITDGFGDQILMF